MTKVLVTGANGFLGRYVVEQHAERGDEVVAFCRSDAPDFGFANVHVVRGDLTDASTVRQTCRGVEVVQHVAGVAGVWGPWERYHNGNMLATQYVIEASRAAGVRALVYTSSPSVTFDGRPQEGVDESTPYPSRWLCHYPHSKALAEQSVLQAAGDDLRTCALRPHLIWGPRDRHLIPRLIERAKTGRLRRVGDGTNLIDMVYVENAAAAQLAAADELLDGGAANGKAYFISQGEPVRCWEWIDQILALANLPPVRKQISIRAAYAVGAVCEAVYRTFGLNGEPPMTRFVALQLGLPHYFDVSAARSDFGFEPTVTIDVGMQKLADWLKDA